MKLLLFDKAYDIYVNPSNPCNKCILRGGTCSKIPASICTQYGGFQPCDTKIFTL